MFGLLFAIGGWLAMFGIVFGPGWCIVAGVALWLLALYADIRSARR